MPDLLWTANVVLTPERVAILEASQQSGYVLTPKEDGLVAVSVTGLGDAASLFGALTGILHVAGLYLNGQYVYTVAPVETAAVEEEETTAIITEVKGKVDEVVAAPGSTTENLEKLVVASRQLTVAVNKMNAQVNG